MKRLLLILFASAFCGISSAQVIKTAEHPFFKAMLGSCQETGKLLLPGAQEPVPMKVTMELQPALDGVWVQEEGKAESSQFSFLFRWMFRVVAQEGGNLVLGRFIDSNGQIHEYAGNFKDEKTLHPRRKTEQGSYLTVVSVTGENQWSIQTLFQPTDAEKAITIYMAEKKRITE